MPQTTAREDNVISGQSPSMSLVRTEITLRSQDPIQRGLWYHDLFQSRLVVNADADMKMFIVH